MRRALIIAVGGGVAAVVARRLQARRAERMLWDEAASAPVERDLR